jgi:hypothetical protein
MHTKVKERDGPTTARRYSQEPGTPVPARAPGAKPPAGRRFQAPLEFGL